MQTQIPTVAATGPIILVDDDPMEATLLAQVLELTGIERPVRSFENGTEFLEHLDRVTAGEVPMPAVVLLDIRMPGMDGFSVLQAVREQERFRDVPVMLMFSNSEERSDLDRALDLGADGYVSKPAQIKGYVAFLSDLLAEDA